MKVIDIVPTPNPDALKFILDGKLVASGARSFETADAAGDDALAKALFASGPVASVFAMDRFVSVTKFPAAEWGELKDKIVAALETHATPVATGDAGAGAGADDLMDKINAVIDQNVRPALAGDGGGLEIVDYDNYVLSVHYQGACGSCPSATTGTLFAIQNLLQRLVDPRIRVMPV
jgi:Fe-S cluster biogenesis protein NfuA